jgi:hypothetical protein
MSPLQKGRLPFKKASYWEGIRTSVSRERLIRKTLKKIAGQRVVGILQPGDIWIVEKALADDEGVKGAIQTCRIRGWIDILYDAIPAGEILDDGQLGSAFASRKKPVYRLTEAGWNAIHRLHGWVFATFIVSLAALLLSVFILIKSP